MTHYSYIEELEKKSKKSQFYWLGFISVVLLAVIVMLVIIKKETGLFVRVQELETRPLTSEERKQIEDKLLSGWAKRELALDDRAEIESQVLGSEAGKKVLTDEDRRSIEQKLNQQ